MKYLTIVALLTLGATGLATLMLYDNGHVSMVWGDWVIETSLSFLMAALILIFLVGYLVIRFGIHIWKIPQYWRQRRTLKRYAKAQSKMEEGLLALEYGDWQKAERALIKSAKQSEAGLVNYLSAAKMAHNQQALERRDLYLEQARTEYPESAEVIGLVEARLLAEKQPERARAILEVLHNESPKNAAVVAELVTILEQLKDWKALEELLPKAKRLKAIDSACMSELQLKLFAGQLQCSKTLAELDEHWQSFNRKLQAEPELMAEYIEQRISFAEYAGLAEMIEKALSKRWNERLVYQYGRLQSGPAYERLKVAEKWQEKHGDSAVLLLTLGRIACRGQLWSRAHGYFRDSLKLRPELETFHALASCYEQEGEEHQAALIYKEAISQIEHKNLGAAS